MKKFRKMMALVIAMVMVLSMSIAVFADGETPAEGGETPAATTTYAITVDTKGDAVTHTYKVYQIFTGTPENGKLTDVQYGSSYPGGTTGSVPKTVLDAITDARAWAETNKGSLGTEVATLNATTKSYDAVPGWYLVLDTAYTATDDTADAYSAFMVEVVDKATEFKPKKEVPSVNKEVSDNADPAGSTADKIGADGTKTMSNEAGYYETADHKFGETFQFRLTATIPAGDYTAYDTYKAVFHDTMSAGITFEKLDSVKIGTTDVTATTTATGIAANDKGPKTWSISFDNVEQVAGKVLESDLVIEVIYSAHLNPEAATNTATGSTTNENKVKLEYSNNPDATGTGETDSTPEDYVWVFAYESDNTKVDKNDKPVAGAEFQLKDSAGTVINLYKVGTVYSVYDAAKATEYTGGEVVDHVTTDGTTGKFDFKGLDAGTYTLTESKVPGGYVQCEDITITIGAATEEVTATTNKVTLTSTNQHNKVVNLTGTTLPSTGGIGTTIFYIIGAILVIGAGIVLVTRRRMSAN